MIKFLIITFLIFLFMRLVAPVLLRYLLAAFIKKKMGNGSFFTSTMHQQRPHAAEPPFGNANRSNRDANGNIKIDYIPEQPNRKDFDGGQYVDYEEVK